MTCEIKSEHHPVQIRCSFPEVTETKRDFSVYFHSSDGSQNAVANCMFNGANRCLAEEGFEVSLEGLNAASLTVPDSFATRTGMFVCQKGDLPFIKNCEFPLTGNSTACDSFNSEVGYGTTTNVISPFVTTEHSGNEDHTQLAIICAAVSVIVVVIFIILLITIIRFKRFKTKKHHKRSKTLKIYRNKEIQPSKADNECKISFLEEKSKSHELVQHGLNAELSRILGSNTATNTQVLGKGFDITEKQELADKENTHLDVKNSDLSHSRQSSADSTFSKESQAGLIRH